MGAYAAQPAVGESHQHGSEDQAHTCADGSWGTEEPP